MTCQELIAAVHQEVVARGGRQHGDEVIMSLTRVNRRSVARAIAGLEHQGHVSVVEEFAAVATSRARARAPPPTAHSASSELALPYKEDNMKFSDKFASGYLKPADLPWTPFRATISGVQVEVVGPLREEKYTVSFRELEKHLVLTPTNGGILARAFGDDTEGCVGKIVDLVVMSGTFDGKVQEFIRIEVPVEQPPSTQAASPDDDIQY